MGREEPGAFPLKSLVSFSILLVLVPALDAQDWALNRRIESLLKCGGGIHVEDDEGEVLLSANSDTPQVPASVLKLATAVFVLETLGPDYRPETGFFYDPESGALCVHGGGDPFLVSEELRIVADSLQARGVTKVTSWVADCGIFHTDLVVDGRGASQNPYDAGIGPLYVNFNTAAVRITPQGTVAPGERETPLTPMAIARARSVRQVGAHRLSILDGSYAGPRYALELLRAILAEKGILVGGEIHIGACAKMADPITYMHKNSLTVREMIRGMLEYSNNLVANTLLLDAASSILTKPPSIDDAAVLLCEFLSDSIHVNDAVVMEGSGLSPKSRLTPRGAVKILHYMEQKGWDQLLPDYDGARAKSGTLNGVSCLAGYSALDDGRGITFSIMLGGSVGSRDKALAMIRQLFR